MNQFKSIFLSSMPAFIIFYMAAFFIYYLAPQHIFIEMQKPIKIFTEFKYVIPIFILCAVNFYYLGKMLAIDEIRMVKARYNNEIKNRIEDLKDYLILAKAITKDDTNVIIDKYIKKLDTKFKK